MKFQGDKKYKVLSLVPGTVYASFHISEDGDSWVSGSGRTVSSSYFLMVT